ncbi:MAG: hypothetical protein OXH08_08710 [Gammaproteobacteria bacterium]|nr:hypothetical protein [Gammaproteobacteria bacterium]
MIDGEDTGFLGVSLSGDARGRGGEDEDRSQVRGGSLAQGRLRVPITGHGLLLVAAAPAPAPYTGVSQP